MCNPSASFLFRRNPEVTVASSPFKPQKESMSLAATKEISTHAAVMAVLSEQDGIFCIIRTTKAPPMAGKDILLLFLPAGPVFV